MNSHDEHPTGNVAMPLPLPTPFNSSNETDQNRMTAMKIVMTATRIGLIVARTYDSSGVTC